jgi:hypothetical protein
MSHFRVAALLGAAITGSVFLAATSTTVQANSTGSISCVGGGGSINCVGSHRYVDGDPSFAKIIKIKKPETEQEIAEANARERKWREHCAPQLKQDRYGVMRYTYAAPNCDLGRLSH